MRKEREMTQAVSSTSAMRTNVTLKDDYSSTGERSKPSAQKRQISIRRKYF